MREGIRVTTPDVSVSVQNDVTSNAAVLVKAVRSDENPEMPGLQNYEHWIRDESSQKCEECVYFMSILYGLY